jgi:hypothetical protein
MEIELPPFEGGLGSRGDYNDRGWQEPTLMEEAADVFTEAARRGPQTYTPEESVDQQEHPPVSEGEGERQ